MQVKLGGGWSKLCFSAKKYKEEILHCRWHLWNILTVEHKYEEQKICFSLFCNPYLSCYELITFTNALLTQLLSGEPNTPVRIFLGKSARNSLPFVQHGGICIVHQTISGAT
jgi:hypothetical protein